MASNKITCIQGIVTRSLPILIAIYGLLFFSVVSARTAYADSLCKFEEQERTNPLFEGENPHLLSKLEAAQRVSREAQLALDISLDISIQTLDAIAIQADRYGIPRVFITDILTGLRAAFRRLFREGVASTEARCQHALVLLTFADAYEVLGEASDHRSYAREALAIGVGLVQEQPGHSAFRQVLSRAYREKGQALASLGYGGESEANFLQAINISRDLRANEPESRAVVIELAESLIQLGDLMFLRGQVSEAAPVYREARQLWERINRRRPDDRSRSGVADSHDRLGRVAMQLARFREAEDHFDKAVDISKRLVESLVGSSEINRDLERDLAVSLMKRGDLEYEQRKPQAARGYYQKSLQSLEFLTKLDPANIIWLREYAAILERIGLNAILALDETAIQTLEKGRRIREELVTRDQQNVIFQRDLSNSHEHVGRFHLKMGLIRDAETAYQSMLKIRRRLSERDQENLLYQRDLSVAFNQLGTLSLREEKFVQAVEKFRKAQSISKYLAAKDPDNIIWAQDLAQYTEALSDALAGTNEWAAARDEGRSAVQMRRNLLAKDRFSSRFIEDLAWSLVALGGIYVESEQFREADEVLTEALHLSCPFINDEIEPTPRLHAICLSGVVAQVFTLFSIDLLDAALALAEQALAFARALPIEMREDESSREDIANLTDFRDALRALIAARDGQDAPALEQEESSQPAGSEEITEETLDL